jgi:hypothetical protein
MVQPPPVHATSSLRSTDTTPLVPAFCIDFILNIGCRRISKTILEVNGDVLGFYDISWISGDLELRRQLMLDFISRQYFNLILKRFMQQIDFLVIVIQR